MKPTEMGSLVFTIKVSMKEFVWNLVESLRSTQFRHFSTPNTHQHIDPCISHVDIKKSALQNSDVDYKTERKAQANKWTTTIKERKKEKWQTQKESLYNSFLDLNQNKKSKRSIFAVVTGLPCSHLPHTGNHRKHLSNFMPLYKRMIAQVINVLDPCGLEWRSELFK